MTGSAKQSRGLRIRNWIASSLALLAMTAMRASTSASLLQILLHLCAKAVAQIGARHGEGDVGPQETRLRAAIMSLALEFDAVEALGLRQPDHRIGKLDL